MAKPQDVKLAVIGLQRFGLGVRPGDLAQIGADIRDVLRAEIRAGELPSISGVPFATSIQAAQAVYAFQEKEQMERAARRSAQMMAAEALPSAPEGALSMPPGGIERARRPDTPEMIAERQRNEDPHNPARIYRGEMQARIHAAMAPLAGFGERLAQFWSNHFCVSATKGAFVRGLAGAYEREAIRPHVFGRFADMLLAAESHPAMLFFLDNQQSLGPNSRAGQRRGRGLNENLAREIMELHTLGVAGGYTQADVTSLARIITGWTIAPREAGNGGQRGAIASAEPGSFIFNDNLHEPGAHIVLGRSYAQPGVEQGRAVLNDLARHPSTAQHIARKLARHFVADDPPAALVARLATLFKESDGDLRAVSLALIDAPEAWNETQAKLRSPQEFLIAASRALGRKPQIQQIMGPLTAMGQRLWEPSGPNGFPDQSAAWATPEGIKTRIDVSASFGRQLGGNAPDPRVLTEAVLGPLASRETRLAVERAESRQQGVALMLMSPEFQRR
jgi:uncharacterized protein (DUF1800 family)